MKVKFFNNTNEIITLKDCASLSFLPGQYTEIDTLSYNITESGDVVYHISMQDLTVNNYDRDMTSTEGIKWLLTGTEQYLKDKRTGKMVVQETSKFPGLYTYWTGRGDDTENGIIGEGTPLVVNHKIGDDKDKVLYADFITINNTTQMHEGYMVWKDAQPGDTASFTVVTSVMPISAGTNTNYNLYNGYLIIPANGDGNIEILGDITSTDPAAGCFVEADIDEKGIKTPAFWKADYDVDTNSFINITPAPLGDGDYNLFAVEVPISRFVNQINFLGSGFERLQSADSDTFNHGLRVKLEAYTSDMVEDHEWMFSAILTLQRDRTI